MDSGAVRPVRRLTYFTPPGGGRGCWVDRLAGGLGEQVRPGPRHHPDQVILSAADDQPAPAGPVVGQRVDRGVGGALRIDAQLQAGQRIEPVGVGAVLAEPARGFRSISWALLKTCAEVRTHRLVM